jgi:plastocyanin
VRRTPRSLVLAALLLVLAACDTPAAPPASPPGSAVDATSAATELPSLTEEPGEIVEVSVRTDGNDLTFDPAEITVPTGATVRLTYTNEARSLAHNLIFIAPLSVGTALQVGAGDSETIEFVAPEPGEYTFVCTLHPGMSGTLIVEG